MTEVSGETPSDPSPETGGFSGQLSQTPLFVVLRRIQREHLSGTLSVFREEQVRQLFFEQGELRSARSAREDHRIGATLVRWGYISESELADALETQHQTHQRIDQVLVEKGFVTRVVVDSEARRQMEQVIFSTLAWRDAAFHFEPNTGPGELDVEVSFSEDVIIEGIRRIPESEQFLELLGDLRSVPRLTKDPMSTATLRALKDSVEVLEHIDGKTSFDRLLQSGSGSGRAAAKILYSLIFAGLIETARPEEAAEAPGEELPPLSIAETLGEETRPLGRDGSAGAASDAGPTPGTRRQMVLNTYRQLDWLSHYDLLDIGRKATQEEIEEAFRTRSRLFDASLNTRPELTDLWRQLTVLSRWLKVAHNVLSDPLKRAAYDQKIDEATPPG